MSAERHQGWQLVGIKAGSWKMILDWQQADINAGSQHATGLTADLYSK